VPERPTLAVLVDGKPMPPEDARALWTRFSAHMDEHQGDMAGFAREQGWFSVAPEYRQGQAVLIVQTTAAAARPKPAPGPGAAARPSSRASARRKRR
jgi:hypothetical protein